MSGFGDRRGGGGFRGGRGGSFGDRRGGGGGFGGKIIIIKFFVFPTIMLKFF